MKGKLIIFILITCFALLGVAGIYLFFDRGEKIQEIDPKAQIDPNRHYVLEVWDTVQPMEWQEKGYQEFLGRISEEFKKVHPNIEIKFHLYDYHEGREKLLKAAKDNQLPDIFCGEVDKEIIRAGFLVPIGHFLLEEEKNNYEQAALELAADAGIIYAWPRWLEVRPWIGNKQMLVDAGVDLFKITAEGWTWEEFAEICAKLVRKRGNQVSIWGFLPYGGSPEIFQQLLISRGIEQIFSPQGDLVWKEKDLEETAAFLRKMQEEKIIPQNGKLLFADNYRAFAQGKGGIAGPINPWVFEGLLENNREVEGILLPIPSKGEQKKIVPVKGSSVMVCRREDRDDRLVAAMEFARFYSRGVGSWVAIKTGRIPAYKPDQIKWGQIPWAQGLNKRILLDSSGFVPIIPLNQQEDKLRESIFINRIVKPSLQDFWTGKFSPEELAEKIDRGAKFSLIGQEE